MSSTEVIDSIIFTPGTAIYIKFGKGRDGGLYSTTIDGATTDGDSFLASSTVCDIGFQKQNLANGQHDVVVKSLGVSAQAPVGNAANLDFEGMMYVYSWSSTYYNVLDCAPNPPFRITQQDDPTPSFDPGTGASPSLRPATSLRTLIQLVGLLIWFVMRKSLGNCCIVITLNSLSMNHSFVVMNCPWTHFFTAV